MFITTSASSLSEYEIQNGEFYLSQWIEKITYSNKEKLALLELILNGANSGQALGRGPGRVRSI